MVLAAAIVLGSGAVLALLVWLLLWLCEGLMAAAFRAEDELWELNELWRLPAARKPAVGRRARR